MNKRSYYVLANSLNLLGVHLVLSWWFKQTVCVSHFTELFLCSFFNGQVNISRLDVLTILLFLFRHLSVMNQGMKVDPMC